MSEDDAGNGSAGLCEQVEALSVSTDAAMVLNADGTPKTKNQLKNEAKKAAKLEKFNAKQSKVAEMQKSAATGKQMKTLDKKGTVDEALLALRPGEKKPMDGPMADAYNPKAVETAWYSWWEGSGFFKPEHGGPVETREKFTLVVPPPNVTGSLHLGHTLTTAVQDSLARWHRMQGHAVLYIPGSDHAGIATQAVVERKLQREKGVTRHDLGREAFLAEVWKWKGVYGDRIYDQLRRMGASADWERACFTLDPKANAAVNEAFCRLFDDGLVFRANRLVHWSGKLKTALSDLEVEMREIAPRSMLPAHGHAPGKQYEFGVMTSFAYRLEDDAEGREIVIATTRPETVFADVAIAVHPTDERYVAFHGRHVIHPVTGTRLPVICDAVADPAFGTGALKISPGHDHTDFEVGQRHGLPCISVLTEDNRLNDRCGAAFAGLLRYDGREAVIAFCKANGTYRGDAPHPMSLPVCTRSGDFVEPRLMPQWWLNCKDMAAASLEAVHSGKLTITPHDHEREWAYWLENIRDWCLSRQLWWGHRVPAYRVLFADAPAGEDVWVAGRDEAEAMARARAKFPERDPNTITLAQDEDVLDTWFSSGLWPLTTLNWPAVQDSDFQHFFPQSLLETGGDILFFWVARMTMLSQYLTGQLPFSQVFLHAMVRDAYGRKMSKSLGNVIDPLDVIEGCTLAHLQSQLEGGNLDPAEVRIAKEGQRRDFPHGIPECGTDALRFALCSYVAQGRDINLNINRVEAYRRLCNKLWNAVRFALLKLGPDAAVEDASAIDFSDFARDTAVSANATTLASGWMLARLARAAEACDRGFASYNLMAVTGAVHRLWQYELCDVYIEAVKPHTANCPATRRVLVLALDWALRLLHPMMPFLTEELWQRLPGRDLARIPSICIAPYPQTPVQGIPEALLSAEAAFDDLFALVEAVRSLATERRVVPKTTRLILVPSTAEAGALLRSELATLAALTRSVGNLELSEEAVADGGDAGIVMVEERPRAASTLYFR